MGVQTCALPILRKSKKLVDLREESNLAEVEIKEGEESVRLARTPSGGAPMAYAPAAAYAEAPRAQQPMPMQSPVDAATGGRTADAGPALPEGRKSVV